MPIKTYNRTNFHKYTFCIFKEVDTNAINGIKLGYKSKSGSCYYFIEDGVYRLSNHWSRVANCKWRLEGNSDFKTPYSNRIKLGFAEWKDFYPDNDVDKIYFLEADYESGTVHFYHKQSANYSSDKVLRSASETTKLIQQVRLLLVETAWAKHLHEENITLLRKEIIQQLITTNQSFQEIRRAYL